MLREKIKTEALKQGFQKTDETINTYKLAKQSGLQITQINKYLKGETDLKGENIEKLFNVLGIYLCCVSVQM
jgi:transcriptional regulator with XRE-family HTH domain